MSATKAEDWRVRYILAFTSLMRDGEIAGLRWSDIETEHGIECVKVRRAYALRGEGSRAGFKAPKTKTSKRTIPLHPLAIEALNAWRATGWEERVARLPVDDDPIFPSERGRSDRPRSAKRFQADLETAGLPTTFEGKPFEFRSTRRSGAAWLEAHGVSGEHIDRLMGHSGQSVRRKHYSATDLDALAQAVRTIRLQPENMDTPHGHGDGGPEENDRQKSQQFQ